MSALRSSALIAGASLAVHDLRYALGGEASGPAAHGYLPLVGLLAGLLLALAGARLIGRVARARRTGHAEPGLAFCRAWLVATVALITIFTAQELLEALLAGASPGPGAVLAGGGWVALPLAVGAGALVALALAGARAAVAAAARRAARRRPASAAAPRVGAPMREHRKAVGVLATHLAGRAPPLPC